MKSNLTKVSLALLSAVFILGCQDLGTGVVASDGAGPQFHHAEGHEKGGGKDDDGGDDRPTYFITVTGDDISTIPKETRAVRDANILIVDEVPMDLSFFDGKLSQSDGTPCGMIGTGVPAHIQISLGRGDDHMHVFFDFDFPVGVTHNIGFIQPPPPPPPGTWPPEDRLVFTVEKSEWVVRAPSKKDQKVACTGEGAAGEETGLDFTITIVPVETS